VALKKRKRKLGLTLLAGLVVVVGLGFLPAIKDDVFAQAGGSNELSGWAWSSNIGWVSFNHTDTGATSDYAVVLDGGNYLSGYAWSPNIGWIKFDPSLSGPSGDGQGAQLKVEENKLTGWARACSVFVSGCDGSLRPDSQLGGWDGWISMNGINYGINYDSTKGGFSGFAWGALNIGWLKFGLNTEDPFQPPENCPVSRVGDCCPAWQVCGGPGGSFEGTCTVDPNTVDFGQEVTWTASASGGTEPYTYTWVQGEGSVADPFQNADPDPISVDDTISSFTTKYEEGTSLAGNYKIDVTVADSAGHSDTVSCSEGVVVGMCVPTGDPVPTPESGKVCCEPDDGDEADRVCGPPIPCLLSIVDPEVNHYVKFVEDQDFPNDSSLNAKIHIGAGCGSPNTTLVGDSLPQYSSLICSSDENDGYSSDCNFSTNSDVWVGLAFNGRPSNFTHTDNWSSFNIKIGDVFLAIPLEYINPAGD